MTRVLVSIGMYIVYVKLGIYYICYVVVIVHVVPSVVPTVLMLYFNCPLLDLRTVCCT